MREIKFRAWDKKNSKYFRECGFLSFCSGGIRFFWIDYKTDHSMITDLPTKDYELLQYTGLKDKNGKEIYEGDIVSHPLCIKEPHDADEPCETFIGRIQYENDKGQWFAVNVKRNGYVIVMTEAYKFEVIGNIYENKELL